MDALAVCERATKGPWISADEDYDDDGYAEPMLLTEDDKQIAVIRVGLKETADNQEFIALARTLLPELIKAMLERHKDTERLEWFFGPDDKQWRAAIDDARKRGQNAK